MKPDTNPDRKKGLILVADDEISSRRILEALLTSLEYQVVLAEDGRQALEMTKAYLPDAVLLDVIMPEMSGFDVCRKIKQNPETAMIPVLMVTALTDHEDLLSGIESGAADFISKPVDLPEVTLRIRNALQTKQLYDQLQKQLIQLKALEHLRDGLVHMIIHDMRSPLTVLKANLEFWEYDDTLKKLDKEETDAFHDMTRSVQTMNLMVNSMLDISRLETGDFPLHPCRCDLNSLVDEALVQMKTMTQKVCIRFTPWKKEIALSGDPEIIKRVITNIVGNAVKYTKAKDEIKIDVIKEKNQGKVFIEDNGPGIPREYHEKIFDKFGQVKSKQSGHRNSYGLGLAFCKLAIEAHHGKIGVKTKKDKGCIFWFSLPAEAV